MKKRARKLTLSRETIRGLQEEGDSRKVVGGTSPTGYNQIMATDCQCYLNSDEITYCIGISCGASCGPC